MARRMNWQSLRALFSYKANYLRNSLKKLKNVKAHHFYLNNTALSADCLKLLKQIFAREAKHASFEGGKYQ